MLSYSCEWLGLLPGPAYEHKRLCGDKVATVSPKVFLSFLSTHTLPQCRLIYQTEITVTEACSVLSVLSIDGVLRQAPGDLC
jgi:hypothetical protein